MQRNARGRPPDQRTREDRRWQVPKDRAIVLTDEFQQKSLGTGAGDGALNEGRIKIDLSIARGLDYYTGTIYETFLTDPTSIQSSIGSVCSGGRYDNLASKYTKQVLPGVGASLGLDRLIAAMEELKHPLLTGQSTPADVLVVQPMLGGGGGTHAMYNAVSIEVVLANPLDDLPEVVRLAWLLSALNLDLPRYSDLVPFERLAVIGRLAMIPLVVEAARQVELVQKLGVGHHQPHRGVLLIDLAAREHGHAEKRQRDHPNDRLPAPHTAPPTLRFRLTIHLRKSSRSAA